MLNAGRLVAPLIFAFVKLVPVMIAPEKSTFVSVAPEKETPESVVPANDAPEKFKPAKLVSGEIICPAKVEPTEFISTEYVAVVDAYRAVSACVAVIVTVPAPVIVTSPVSSPTVANEMLLLVYVIAPGLALVAVTVNASSITLFVAGGGLSNASVGVAFETVSVLLVLEPLIYSVVSA